MTYKELYEDFHKHVRHKSGETYNPRYHQLIEKHGGVKAATILIGKMDWALAGIEIEYFVAHPKYKRLFTADQRQIAKLRLQLAAASPKSWYRKTTRYNFRTGEWYTAKSKLKIVKAA